ncbi:hypothetical protein [Roseiconus lacunae]|uniref:Uncharacterized protein n=1 Tax=Roseiconus lacunae TaxID=2605694 RepID=A0ABT7PH91_9BACT|nr:hypothetical protein [Roseiconus lacunae]MDM4015850.1 hypothetical protein [Roseiconus lacunae]
MTQTHIAANGYGVHVKHILVPVSEVRFYSPGMMFEDRDPYELSLNWLWKTPAVIEVSSLDKLPTKEHAAAHAEITRLHGITESIRERNGKMIAKKFDCPTPLYTSHPLETNTHTIIEVKR